MKNWVDEKALQNNFGSELTALGWREIKFSNIIRTRHDEIVLQDILKKQLKVINPHTNIEILNKAYNQITTQHYPTLLENNTDFCQKMIDGIFIEDNNEKINPHIKFIDFNNIPNNDFAFVHEYTITQNEFTKRADTILFVNGLPLILIEFKSPTNNNTIENAYQQIQNYMYNTPNLFIYNLFSIISDGHIARYGSLTASFERFMTWKITNIDDKPENNIDNYQLDTLIKGLLNKSTILEILQDFTIFTTKQEKIVPAYHQYYGIKKAIASIKNAQDGRAGVIWHTQGSGKSLSMVFLSHKIISNIPQATILVVTDRTDLDEQLHATFAKCYKYLKLPHSPYKIESNRELIKALSNKQQGDIIFTTIQKFNEAMPLLSIRSNIIVIADEAHRTQYGIDGKFKVNEITQEVYEQFGYAKYMRNALPNAIFIGFTGTPIDNKEKSTYKIFGKNIDTYDMLQSVKDGNTVPIKYEAQLIKVKYDESLIGNIFYDFKEFNNLNSFMNYGKKQLGETVLDKTTDELINLETIIGDQDRLQEVVKLFIKHYNNRKEQLYGKAMYVAYSRKIAYEVYQQLTSNPEFKDKVKLIMTTNSQDSIEMSKIVGNNNNRNAWIKEFKDKNSALKIIIVVEMLLTGFDVPCLDVMYIDKPLRMHTLMQAIARVNRTFQEGDLVKNYGLIVDFIGLGKYLNEAIAAYTTFANNYPTIETISTVISRLKDQYEALCNMFHHFNFGDFTTSNSNGKYTIIKNAYEFILEQDKFVINNSTEKTFLNRFMKQAKLLEEGFKYAINQLEPDFKIKLSFFIALRAFISKNLYNQAIIPANNFKNALKDILESAIVSKELVTISNLNNDHKIDILDTKNIAKLKSDYPPRTLIAMVVNWLQKEINLLANKNIVKSDKFQEKLAKIIDSYNKVSDPEAMFHSIVELAKEIKQAKASGLKLGLTPEEEAFYDALCQPENIKREYDKAILIAMAKDLLSSVNRNATVDWYKKKDAKAKMRVEIKQLLHKYKYPPEHYKNAEKSIMQQAEQYATNLKLN